ncbi:DNA-binding response OmpR family regulator [Rhizobium sp. BK181]|uniref:response regulator n=1 Tax=Rhizobium sp. BK181 TaxID=2587072 RepID=UPI00161BC1A8|nr:response regulator [Rhizobium sp. BK181]MBB3320449.1 DNA-binding response OmpR family regulator [Rhizobium sp. BK181]
MNFIDLVGKRVLVVEDDYLQASNVTFALEDQGSEVIGPFPDLESSLLSLEARNIDVAVLDIHLGSDLVYPVADRLDQARVPFVFATAGNESGIPDRFCGVRRLLKPFSLEELAVELAILVAERRVTWQ